MSKRSEYEVGFGKPPRETRFKKGQTGNPKGRPRGSKDRTFQEIVERELNSKITVKIGARQQKITISEAMTKAQIQQALKGDHKSFALLTHQLERRKASEKEALSPILDAMRAINAKHEAEDQPADVEEGPDRVRP